jgi:hypothetical protein
MKKPDFSPLDVERELRRIGADLKRLTGLAGRGLKPVDFVNWLRTIPGGVGHEGFMARLYAPSAAGGPHRPGPDEPPAPDALTYRDPEIEERKAFVQELKRVVPQSTWAEGSAGFGFDLPHGLAHALAVLRALPDRAGSAAFINALNATPPLGTSPGGAGA